MESLEDLKRLGPHTWCSLQPEGQALPLLHFTLSGLSLPNSSLSPNGSGVISLFYTLREPQTPLTLLTTWNCDSVNFPNYSSVLCTRQGLSQLQLSQLLGLVPAREEEPKSCLLNEQICSFVDLSLIHN